MRYFIVLLFGMCSFMSCLAVAAEKPRLAYTVVCEDAALSDRLQKGLLERLQKAGVEVSDKAPMSRLFLYVIRDVNSNKNKAGVTLAVAHVSNIPVLALASETINVKKEQPSPLLINMLREEGFIHHLSAAHIDEASDSQIGIVLDSVVATFVAKNER